MFCERLNDKNYIQYAMRNYDNPAARGVEEFEEDMARIVYLKRLFRKYQKTGNLRERLILNHIITFYNVFGVEPATRLLFFRIDSELHYILKTFLIYLGYLPEGNPNYHVTVDVDTVPVDRRIVAILRTL